MKKLIGYLVLIYAFVWIALIFIILYPFFRYFLSDSSRYYLAHRTRIIWAKGIVLTCFLRKKIYMEQVLDPKKTYIIVANHTSYLDIAAISLAVPLDLNFMAKSELASIPLFGIFFRTIDIQVNRSNAVSGGKAFVKAEKQLSKGIRSLVIFPEGGIRPAAPKLSPFKDGPFKLAISQQVDIIPVTMPDNYKRLNSKASSASPGLMRIYVHKPVSVQGLTIQDAEKLKDDVYKIIRNKLEECNIYK